MVQLTGNIKLDASRKVTVSKKVKKPVQKQRQKQKQTAIGGKQTVIVNVGQPSKKKRISKPPSKPPSGGGGGPFPIISSVVNAPLPQLRGFPQVVASSSSQPLAQAVSQPLAQPQTPLVQGIKESNLDFLNRVISASRSTSESISPTLTAPTQTASTVVSTPSYTPITPTAPKKIIKLPPQVMVPLSFDSVPTSQATKPTAQEIEMDSQGRPMAANNFQTYIRLQQQNIDNASGIVGSGNITNPMISPAEQLNARMNPNLPFTAANTASVAKEEPLSYEELNDIDQNGAMQTPKSSPKQKVPSGSELQKEMVAKIGKLNTIQDIANASTRKDITDLWNKQTKESLLAYMRTLPGVSVSGKTEYASGGYLTKAGLLENYLKYRKL